MCYYPIQGKQENTRLSVSASFLTDQQHPLLPNCATAGTPAPISWRIYVKFAAEAVFSILPLNKHLSKRLMASYKPISYSSGRTDVTHRRKLKKKRNMLQHSVLCSTRQQCHKECLIWRQINIQYKETKFYIFIILC